MHPEKAIPDTGRWGPREKAATTLAQAYEARCSLGEKNLLSTLEHEKAFSVDNFDTGTTFEAAVRAEIEKLLPRRYAVTTGIAVDRNGANAGQCDVVVFNDMWFTTVNAPTNSRTPRLLVPVEGIYAVGEVKQQLSSATLDDAMEKLVACHRLHRPPTYAHRLVENRESDNCEHGLTNPLFSFILAGNVERDELQPLIHRFYEINRQLRRLEVVRCLCILGHGAVTWAFSDPLRRGESRPALFMEGDLFHPIVPAFSTPDNRAPFFALVQALQLHLYHSILAPEDIATAYSDKSRSSIQLPSLPDIALLPDEEWIRRLEVPCSHRRKSE